jgi:hypothetical protein
LTAALAFFNASKNPALLVGAVAGLGTIGATAAGTGSLSFNCGLLLDPDPNVKLDAGGIVAVEDAPNENFFDEESPADSPKVSSIFLFGGDVTVDAAVAPKENVVVVPFPAVDKLGALVAAGVEDETVLEPIPNDGVAVVAGIGEEIVVFTASVVLGLFPNAIPAPLFPNVMDPLPNPPGPPNGFPLPVNVVPAPKPVPVEPNELPAPAAVEALDELAADVFCPDCKADLFPNIGSNFNSVFGFSSGL